MLDSLGAERPRIVYYELRLAAAFYRFSAFKLQSAAILLTKLIPSRTLESYIVARQQPQAIDQRQNDLGQNYSILFLMRMTGYNTKRFKARSQNN